MSGEQKIKIALSLSQLVQKIHAEGEVTRKRHYGNRSNTGT